MFLPGSFLPIGSRSASSGKTNVMPKKTYGKQKHIQEAPYVGLGLFFIFSVETTEEKNKSSRTDLSVDFSGQMALASSARLHLGLHTLKNKTKTKQTINNN